MGFNLTIGTEKAKALQDSIQAELIKREYTHESDRVMAEYITIMLINNKMADQITTELQDLIGVTEYDASFTDWLFEEAARKSEMDIKPESSPLPQAVVSPSEPQSPTPARRVPSAPRSGAAPIYNQALSQALPSGSQSAQKRTASARSPSPNGQGPSKSRRVDLPTGPRAMHRDGGRSLLDRMGGRSRGQQGRDDIQARIEAVTHGGGIPQEMMGGPMNGFNNGMGPVPGMMPMMQGPNGVDMSAMMNTMNPMALQEVMMNQMALMAQMANSIGMLNAQQGQIMQQVPQGGFGGQGNGHQGHQAGGNRRGGGQGGRGRGRGGAWNGNAPNGQQDNVPVSTTPVIAASTSAPTELNPTAPAFTPSLPLSNSTPGQQPGFSPPSRPQSPTLCKFASKCVNALCRYSHPSPVATPESGVVLSNDACENGRACKDKDCVKAHVSPAAAGGTKVSAPNQQKPEATPAPAPSYTPPTFHHRPQVPCRFGVNCLKQASGCPYLHPQPSHSPFSTPCRFGAGCTRADCAFQHPPGRVLPNTFHRGLGTNAPAVTLQTPETGSMGSNASMNRSVVFNKGSEGKKKAEEKVEGGKGPSTVEAAA